MKYNITLYNTSKTPLSQCKFIFYKGVKHVYYISFVKKIHLNCKLISAKIMLV